MVITHLRSGAASEAQLEALAIYMVRDSFLLQSSSKQTVQVLFNSTIACQCDDDVVCKVKTIMRSILMASGGVDLYRIDQGHSLDMQKTHYDRYSLLARVLVPPPLMVRDTPIALDAIDRASGCDPFAPVDLLQQLHRWKAYAILLASAPATKINAASVSSART